MGTYYLKIQGEVIEIQSSGVVHRNESDMLSPNHPEVIEYLAAREEQRVNALLTAWQATYDDVFSKVTAIASALTHASTLTPLSPYNQQRLNNINAYILQILDLQNGDAIPTPP